VQRDYYGKSNPAFLLSALRSQAGEPGATFSTLRSGKRSPIKRMICRISVFGATDFRHSPPSLFSQVRDVFEGRSEGLNCARTLENKTGLQKSFTRQWLSGRLFERGKVQKKVPRTKANIVFNNLRYQPRHRVLIYKKTPGI
jgi:hypothetical protein